MDDDFLLQQELEALAGNAFIPESSPSTSEPMSETISRWASVFKISSDEATDRIIAHRNNLTRTTVSNDHWETVRTEVEAKGHDRASYEYSLDLQKNAARLQSSLPAVDGPGSSITYLVELTGPLDSAERVKNAGKMKDSPVVVSGRSVEESRAVQLCCVDAAAKAEILRWATVETSGFEPTILVDPRSMR